MRARIGACRSRDHTSRLRWGEAGRARRARQDEVGLGKMADPKTAGSATRSAVQSALVCFERAAHSFELAYRLGFRFGLQLVGIVDEAIHQGVGKSRIAEGGVP